MHDEPHLRFGTDVNRALVAYQLIEENLKLYINFSFQLIRIKLSPSIPFKFEGAEFDNAPLERLLHVFSRLTDNELLVARLNKLKSDRNFVAHYALVDYLKGIGDPAQA